MFLFFGLMGNVIGKVRKNFYIGVRVPWTLASDRVWNDTHRMAAWLWVAAGVLGFVADRPGRADLRRDRAADRCRRLIPVIYSFVHYKSLERRGALVSEAAMRPRHSALVDPAGDLVGRRARRRSSRSIVACSGERVGGLGPARFESPRRCR